MYNNNNNIINYQCSLGNIDFLFVVENIQVYKFPYIMVLDCNYILNIFPSSTAVFLVKVK